MTLELQILATVSRPLRWSTLQSRLPGRSLQEMVEGVLRPVAPDAELSPPKVYAVDSTTVTIVPMLNAGNYDEAEYVQDYGRNLSAAERAEVTRRWRAGGRWYGVQGASGDTALLITVASTLAEVTDGYITVLDRRSQPGVGVYRPNEFRAATRASS